jgi:hypothetical protein
LTSWLAVRWRMAGERAHQIPVPASILDADTLDDPSYVCAFAIRSPPHNARTAEQWLRNMFEGAPRSWRAFILSGWIGALRLRLGPRPSPDHVTGWQILSNEPTSIVIAVEGPMLSAHQVVQIKEAEVIHVTIVHFARPVARPIWAVAAPIHIRTIPRLMNRVRAKTSTGA